MDPQKTGEAYDKIAEWWQEQHVNSSYGLPALKRALEFSTTRGKALDVGCGSSGRFLRKFDDFGYVPVGVDISAKMIESAKRLDPEFEFHCANIVDWEIPTKFDLITAWDSTFHLPLECQEMVLEKMCRALTDNGVILFTCGGTWEPEEISGNFQGQTFEYSTLGISSYLSQLEKHGVLLRHLEYDQWPENHVFIIGQKASPKIV
ncbi:MAG: class I SAM-dependent methyltransferase [Verrucomicrobiota bacterium]|nr:class I SAM-dependent methyltransferase [Verrucomicrobiota bacterium]